jgi:hypothetical protein
MRDLGELNINGKGNDIKNIVPTPEVVAAFESRYGIKIPSEYLSLLQFSNGGHPELDSYETELGWLSVNRFYSLDTENGSVDNLWVAMEQWRVVLGGMSIPFANDGGGNVYFLNCGVLPPTVNICLHDEGFRKIEISGSFGEFIDGLKENPDFI